MKNLFLLMSLLVFNTCFTRENPDQNDELSRINLARDEQLESEYWTDLGKSYTYKSEMGIEFLLSSGVIYFVIQELIKGRESLRMESDVNTAKGNRDVAAVHAAASYVPFLIRSLVLGVGSVVWARALAQFVSQLYREAEFAKLQSDKIMHRNLAYWLDDFSKSHKNRVEEADKTNDDKEEL